MPGGGAMVKSRRGWILLGTAMGALACLAYAARYCLTSFEDQIDNAILFQDAASTLALARSSAGVYPASFSCVDRWGRPALYLSNGSHYVLVSYGRDNVPDTADYATWLAAGTLPRLERSCFTPNADTLFVDGQAVRACFK